MPYSDLEKKREYQREYQKEWRNKNRDKLRKYQTKYRETTNYREKVRERTGAIPLDEWLKKITKPLKEWGNPNLDKKTRARRNTVRAVRQGKLNKPDHCDICTRQLEKKFIEAHHRNYDDWLDIQWLCRLCHTRKHRI